MKGCVSPSGHDLEVMRLQTLDPKQVLPNVHPGGHGRSQHHGELLLPVCSLCLTTSTGVRSLCPLRRACVPRNWPASPHCPAEGGLEALAVSKIINFFRTRGVHFCRCMPLLGAKSACPGQRQCARPRLCAGQLRQVVLTVHRCCSASERRGNVSKQNQGLLPGSQGHDLASTILCVSYLLDRGF